MDILIILSFKLTDCLVKAMVFPMDVRVGLWRKLSAKELMLWNCGFGEDSWVPWAAKRSNQSILKEISPEYSLEGLLLKLKTPILWPPDAKSCLTGKDPDERLKAGGEGGDRGWDGSMASPTWWTWVWVNSRNWWWTGRPGMLQSMGSQRVRHNWVTEQQDIYLLSFQSLSRVWLFATPWTIARQASLSITNSQSPPKPMSIESVMPVSVIRCCPLLLCPQSFPASGSFPMSQLFASGGQSIGVGPYATWPSKF